MAGSDCKCPQCVFCNHWRARWPSKSRGDPLGICSLILIFGGISTCGGYFYGHRKSSLSEHSHWSLFPCCCDVLISQAAQAAGASRDALIDLFERMENIFRRLETYTNVPPTAGMTEAIMKVMVEVLRILAIATKEIKQNRASELTSCSAIDQAFWLTVFQKNS